MILVPKLTSDNIIINSKEIELGKAIYVSDNKCVINKAKYNKALNETNNENQKPCCFKCFPKKQKTTVKHIENIEVALKSFEWNKPRTSASQYEIKNLVHFAC